MKDGGWSACVLGEFNAYLASAAKRSEAMVTPGVLRDAHHTLDRAARLFKGGPGVLALLGGRDLLASWAGQRGALDSAGWTCTAVESWTTWRRRDAPAVHVAMLGTIEPTPLFNPLDDPRTIAVQLAWYADVMGGEYLMTPGVAGHVAIKAAFKGKREPYWGLKDIRRDGDERQGSGDLLWRRAPLKTEFAEGYVHGFDLRAARLAALGVVEVAWTKLEPTGQVAYDPDRAGYWLIPPPPQHKRHPPIVNPDSVHDRLAWVTGPIMADLARRNILPDVIDSWTGVAKRPFRTIAERWDAARLATIEQRGAAMTCAHDAVKATYREAAGLMARPGGSIYRPDWYHATMDRQRVTVLSHAERIAKTHERRPLAIHTDCLWYASTESDPEKAADRLGIKLGHRLGCFDVKSSATTAEFFKAKAGAR
jgi:hypothetical protein